MTPRRWIGALLLTVLVGGCAPTRAPTDQVTITFHFSHFTPDRVTVPAGVPVSFTLENDDPIAHEWIVGPPALHQVHRTGTEAWHAGRPNEVSLAPFSTRATTVVFDQLGEIDYICHLPGHEEYGMKGTVTVVPNDGRFATR
ncbi:MAG TPA: cupredoxin domain-containing protein [Chloroflexota bacterium]|nr:cupredoxin domain-containing protein [Chloroflexota bacterium]